MPRYAATVGCPACNTRFQAPVEQILDVRVDPSVKNRIISGMVNVAICPNCGAGGSLNLPFIYHDPENEVALLYLPVNIGKGEVERQQVAGQLTQRLMNGLVKEERKGYLLQPETFISMESLVKRVLEIEGVSQEDMDRGRAQREFLDEYMAAESPEDWARLIEENQELLDESFFAMLEYTLQMTVSAASAGPQEVDLQRIQEAYDYLIENSEMGQTLAKRSQVVQIFAQDPNRETLLEALIAAPDDETIAVLVQSGVQFLDYPFFQQLVKRVNAAEETGDDEEKARLSALRRKILEFRDQIMAASDDIAKKRADLIKKLIASDDPLKMARGHLSELDDAFFFILRANLEEAQKQGDKDLFGKLRELSGIINQILEESMPPAVALARRLMTATDDERMKTLLEQNRQLLSRGFFQLIENLIENSQTQGDEEVQAQLEKIRTMARQYAPEPGPPQSPQHPAGPQQPPQQPPSGPEKTTPSGLIIAKH